MGWDHDRDWYISTQSTMAGQPGISEADKAMVHILMDIRRVLREINERLIKIESLADGAIVVAKGDGSP